LGYVDSYNRYQQNLSNSVFYLDPLGESVAPAAWTDFKRQLDTGKDTACNLFVKLLEGGMGASPVSGDFAGAFVPNGRLTGKGFAGAMKALMRTAMNPPTGFGTGDWGAVFEYFDAIFLTDPAKLEIMLGFNSCVSANNHYNFAHFSGIWFCKQHWNSNGESELMQQLREDLADYKKRVIPKDHRESCAEIRMDLITLRYLDGLAAAKSKGGHVAIAAFQKTFDLQRRLCKGDNNGCDPDNCEQDLKEIEGYLKGLEDTVRDRLERYHQIPSY
jgi:hypothetical protein